MFRSLSFYLIAPKCKSSDADDSDMPEKPFRGFLPMQRCMSTGKTASIGFGTIHSCRHPLGTLDKEGFLPS